MEQEVRDSIERRLSHLDEGIAVRVGNILIINGAVTKSLHYTGPATRPVKHPCWLQDGEHIYVWRTRLLAQQNDAVREQLEEMLNADMFTPALCAWSIPVVIAKKEVRNPPILR